MIKKIAILYICTGKYVSFWDNFYKSMSKYFLIDYEKHYYVFTDGESKMINKYKNVHIIYQQKLGWPYDTLFRFKMFNSIDEQLKGFDYIFFLNANMVCVSNIGEEILPNHQQKLLAVTHPGFYNKDRLAFTYETNPVSLAHVKPHEGEYYFMGGFNGGIGEDFRVLIKTLNSNIEEDIANHNFIAVWHDESHLNNYLLNKLPKILSPSYGYPQGWDMPFEQKIIILDKAKLGGHNYLRSTSKIQLKQKALNFLMKFRNGFK